MLDAVAARHEKVGRHPEEQAVLDDPRARVQLAGQRVHIRRDAKWNVPEPELALVVSPSLQLVGYTIGNDMSSRDIEGENPLYLPQAKVYDGSCALGPCVLVQN